MARIISSGTGEDINFTPGAGGHVTANAPVDADDAATKLYVDSIYRRRLIGVKTYSSGATWTKPANFTSDSFVIVTVVGGGGGSGGTAATSGTQWAASSAGGGAGTAIKLIPSSSLGATETISVGAGGAGGAAGSNNGTAGGTSSFGAHCSATGGGGGIGGAATATTTISIAGRAAGGVATGGDVNMGGGESTVARTAAAVGPYISFTGIGFWGGGQQTNINSNPSGSASPPGASNPGNTSFANQSAKAGMAGIDGCVVVMEYL
jgi:hypothetical protein